MYVSRDRFGELKVHVENVFALLPEPSALKRWKPALNDSYFIITLDGSTMPFTWNNTQFDQFFWELGNCFKTRQEAEQACDAIHTLVMHFHNSNIGSSAQHTPVSEWSATTARPRRGVVTDSNARRRVSWIRQQYL